MNFKGIVKGKNYSEVSRTGNSDSGIIVEADTLLNKIVVKVYDGVWASPEQKGIPYCRISIERGDSDHSVFDGKLSDLWTGGFKKRRFKVLDSSGLGFGINFNGMVLDYVCEGYPHKGSISLKQPPEDINGKPCIGTVTFDVEHVEEV